MPAFLELPPPSLHAAMNFAPAQRNAINHTPGSLQPIVCAGSGKMEVRWPGAWPRRQRGPTFPTRSAAIGRSRDRVRLVEIFQTRLAKLTADAKMLIWNR